ncbi:NUDIX hydrolase [Paraferrimonas sedimenticola]|uniref:Coenzyme A pyrophosphatase n=1 Tax=Paraferrimonas sedimenticola TaxID=375674 RepID=A0AA37VWU6_9GAMM|nr:CoA pyrophosphatase [Paraferrimonas sedimenticola]GLP96429.1 coenzyme A pyrophosphatase [Paraferrimonas sedimenticola]
MQLAEARSRLLLSQQAPASPYPVHNKANLKQSAVLLGLWDGPEGVHIWFTQRPMYLKHHPGQISLPGGKYEDGDTDLTQTALREAFEEIHLKPQQAEVICRMPTHYSHTGFAVTPIVASIERDFSPIADPNEVADCFSVPLSFFLNSENLHQMQVQRNQTQYPVYFMPYQGRLIWGVTGAILYQFSRSLI